MPLSYQIDPQRQLIEVRASGRITLAELRAHFIAQTTDPLFCATYDAVVDYRSVSEFLTPEELRRFAAALPEWLSRVPSRRALVADHDVVYGMFRMLEAFTSESPVTLRVFRRIEDARGWLAGVHEPD